SANNVCQAAYHENGVPSFRGDFRVAEFSTEWAESVNSLHLRERAIRNIKADLQRGGWAAPHAALPLNTAAIREQRAE
ncbi:hypothetical protein, partial [Roseovarius sp.]|uniref:hypothetical protein n=1 Tax=Roseovarius sp. TaxID=1486281 RepID=UPI0035697DC2